MTRFSRRERVVGLALAAGVIASGCGLLSNDPPAQACATASEGFELVDPDAGFALCLPPNWRDLRTGDPAWVTVYGEHGLSVEQDVDDGVIQHFSLPLEPRDVDEAVNLAVYVRELPAGTTVQMLGDQYVTTLARLDMGVLGRAEVEIPAGVAVRITAGRQRRPAADSSSTASSRTRWRMATARTTSSSPATTGPATTTRPSSSPWRARSGSSMPRRPQVSPRQPPPQPSRLPPPQGDATSGIAQGQDCFLASEEPVTR